MYSTTAVLTDTSTTCPYPRLHAWRNRIRAANNMAPIRCKSTVCEWSLEMQSMNIQDAKEENDVT